jgi:hypothetical protein
LNLKFGFLFEQSYQSYPDLTSQLGQISKIWKQNIDDTILFFCRDLQIKYL